MKRYLYRSNNIPMAVLGWKSPNQKQHELGGVGKLPLFRGIFRGIFRSLLRYAPSFTLSAPKNLF